MRESGILERQLYRIGLIVLALGGLFGFVYFKFFVTRYTYPCVFYSGFGFYCPGCGGTRAVLALLHGRFLEALWYHPLVPYSAALFAGFMLTQTLERLHVGNIKGWKFHNWYLWAALAIIICNWALKNYLWLTFGIEV